MMQLLINADDFGISDNVNLAIDYCFKNNLIHRTSIMVNMESTDYAASLAKENGYDDKVGLHINLIEGVPLTEPIKNTYFCTNGKFNGSVLRKQINRFYLNKQVRDAVGCEIRAQIQKYITYGFTLYHADSHEHTHTNPSVFRLLLPLMKEYNFRTMRLSRNIPKSEISGFKLIYKTILNKKIITFNKRCEKQNVLFFGSQTDVVLSIKNSDLLDSGMVEMELHPSMNQSGELIELYYPINIKCWLDDKQIREKICLVKSL